MANCDLKLDWCSYEAAKFAVMHWHYSKAMPVGKMVRIGALENGTFIGCVLFSLGATSSLGNPYRISRTEVCELTRVALDSHISAVSRIVSIAIKFLRQRCPGLRLIVSFADTNQGHIGIIYQAGNWVYTGRSNKEVYFKDKSGRVWHPRLVTKSGIVKEFSGYHRTVKRGECAPVHLEGKHRYLMPLDDAMRSQVEKLRQPYPKRAGSDTVDTSATHAEEGGSIPTPALQAV